MAADVGRSGEQPLLNSEGVTSSEDARRFWVLRTSIWTLLIFAVASLCYHPLAWSADSAALDQRQSQRRGGVPAPRGLIYDREHRLLAGNRTWIAATLRLGELSREALQQQQIDSHSDSSVHPADARFQVLQRQLNRINAITGHRVQIDAIRFEQAFAHERSVPFVLDDNLTVEEGELLTARLNPSDDVQLIRTDRRWYPHRNAAAHVLGRVRIDRTAPQSVRTDDNSLFCNIPMMVGDSGIEKYYEAGLQGRSGEVVESLDALGSLAGPALQRRAVTPGKDLILSLDLDLQLAAERAMAATPGAPRGAAVAIDVQSGEILVLASKPDFDLNAVSPTIASDYKQQIDAQGGWLNRATQGLYPPGSTFKIITALAGLRRGTLHPDDVVHCEGFYELNGHRFLCHNPEGHGDVTLRTALAQSCNVFAYRTGLAAGPIALAEEARHFHLGEPTQIDLPSETTRMLVPDPAWKQKNNRGAWTTGDTINLSIGQGFLRYTPLQAACAIASLARRETLTVPTLLHQPGRKPTGDRPPEPLGLNEGDYTALIESLQAVIQNGIGQNAQVPGVAMAGKTGTAQLTRTEGTINVAWFVAFAPVSHPEIAVAVAMEGDQPGVEFAGGEHAAPIVREIIGSYFDKRKNR